MADPLVEIEQGKLRGCVAQNYTGEHFYKFLGIPYGKPPVGELRFKSPLPADSWQYVRDATKEGSRCYSRNEITLKLSGSEDCLFLNVYTKKLPSENAPLLPVMVYIHGGAFSSGSSTPQLYGPEFLLTEDIVLVTINYRLGILGFLSLQDSSLGVPGNAGLKDQRLALQWVQKNIEKFGGNPQNVTLFGESAGAASTHFHLLSSSSKNLFHKAILQSGTALNPWAIGTHDPVVIAQKIDSKVSTVQEAFEVLKSCPVEKLVDIQESYSKEHAILLRILFAPVIENESSADAIITKDPMEIILSGEYNQVPIVLGYTNLEGLLFELLKKRHPEREQSGNAPSLEDVIPWPLRIEKGSNLSRIVVEKLQKCYFRGPDMKENLRVLLTDTSFLSGIIACVKGHKKTSKYPVYLYRMSVETSLNFYKRICGVLDIPGVCHADDLGYLFKNISTPEDIPEGSIEDISIRRFVKLWTSFAAHGKFDGLEVEWKPVNENCTYFLDIDKELCSDADPDNDRVNLWKEIYEISNNSLAKNVIK